MSSLSIRNICKSYGTTEILKNINLEIEDGEFVILVGPSGCGKSTLLNLIAGLDEITAGEIYADDKLMNDLPPRSRDIAMVFQSYALYPTMTVRKNISFGLEMRKVPKAERERIVEEVAQTLQIGELLDRKPSQLSGGQRQRVAMGRAISRKAGLFLFDEPLSNLDAKLRMEMRTEMKLLHHRLQTTVLYVTHDQVEAMVLADKIAVMKSGEVQQYGAPQQVYDNPVNLFVAGFMGSPSMNVIRVAVVKLGDGVGIVLRARDREIQVPIKIGHDHLQAWAGKEVLFGIRPEQITHKGSAYVEAAHLPSVTLPVDITEPTGADTLVLVTINNAKVTCRIDPDYIKPPGEDIDLVFDISKAVFFDPDTEMRIT